MNEASLYEKMPEGGVRCLLCRHYCRLRDGRRGICGVRQCRGDRLYTLVADRLVAIHVDPIEKKPLFHFLPGTRSLSLATVGCNFRCRFCQNYSISQHPTFSDDIPGQVILPEEVVQSALEQNCASISYTYTEPTVFFELTRAVGTLARREGLRNIYVTNGYMSPEAIAEMTPFLDAANVDLKSFSDDFYRQYCGARLEGVLDSVRLLHDAGVWLELTTLVIPGCNSSLEELSGVARFIASLDASIPWHVSAFHPDYRMQDTPSTPLGDLENAWQAGREAGLEFVYCGNVPGHQTEHTHCPKCGQILIERRGFSVLTNRLTAPRCPSCGATIAIQLVEAGTK